MNESERGVPDSEINEWAPYIADLEVEIDRLRRQAVFVEQAVRDGVLAIRKHFQDEGDVASITPQIKAIVDDLALMLQDVHERPGYDPRRDQVVAVAVRPLVEQIFRWHQRVNGAPQAVLRQTLESESIEWFPARLRHIFDGLISNALRFRAPSKGECRVGLAVRRIGDAYEIRISDNGQGIPPVMRPIMLDLLYRAGPARPAGAGVGLAVVRLLVEQSGGSLTVESSEAGGTCFTVILPRFDIDDFINPA